MMSAVRFILALSLLAGSVITATAQDVLKVAVPQRGSWDAGVPELGQRGGIFKKHGLTLEILYTQAGPESIQALIRNEEPVTTNPIPIFRSDVRGNTRLTAG